MNKTARQEVASNGSSMVEELPHHSKVMGLIQATTAGARRGEMAKKVGEESTSDFGLAAFVTANVFYFLQKQASLMRRCASLGLCGTG